MPARLLAPALPLPPLTRGGYRLRLVRTERDLERVQRLRFEVFNRELGEGFQESWATGCDQDPYDTQVHHLLVEETATGAAVGTYRLQTRAMAEAGCGFYTAEEYDLAPLEPFLDRAVEASRACVHKDHRRGPAFLLLWAGIARYLRLTRSRHLFGLCSLTSQDPDDGLRAWRLLREDGRLHPVLRLRARPEFHVATFEELDTAPLPPLPRLPALFDAYLRIGTRIAGAPALDRAFGTVDFLAWLDLHEVPAGVLRRFGYR